MWPGTACLNRTKAVSREDRGEASRRKANRRGDHRVELLLRHFDEDNRTAWCEIYTPEMHTDQSEDKTTTRAARTIRPEGLPVCLDVRKDRRYSVVTPLPSGFLHGVAGG